MMRKYVVRGGKKLSGTVTPIGNKNSVLKLIPASILFEGDYVLENVPAISDVEVMTEILAGMGAAVDYRKEDGYLRINTDGLNTHEIPVALAKKLRASVVLIGPLLARFGKAKSVFPGGDKIGERELTAHFESLAQLGAQVSGNEWGEFEVNAQYLKSGSVYLYEPSVTATENVIMAAAKTEGVTIIKGAACEPHVQELCSVLVEAGVEIDGIGSNVLVIKGSKVLKLDHAHSIWPDYIDVATAAVAAAITGGSVRVKDIRAEDLITIKFFFEQLGLDMQLDGNDLVVTEGQNLKLKDKEWGRIKGVYSQPWYAFPSDLMSIAIVLAMKVEGSVLFFEKLYRDRMSFTADFNSAGANIISCDPHRIYVNGPTNLNAHNYHAPDLRAGMAYFLAALISDGVSEITGVEHIERGYPNTIERYKQLGADVEML